MILYLTQQLRKKEAELHELREKFSNLENKFEQIANEDFKKGSSNLNPSLIVDLDFVTPIDYKSIRSEKHARIIKSMMD